MVDYFDQALEELFLDPSSDSLFELAIDFFEPSIRLDDIDGVFPLFMF